jgi:hypothetical protein
MGLRSCTYLSFLQRYRPYGAKGSHYSSLDFCHESNLIVLKEKKCRIRPEAIRHETKSYIVAISL